MKKLLIGTLAIMFSIFGLQKLADALNTTVKNSAVESEHMIAANGWGPKGGNIQAQNEISNNT